VKYWLIKQEPSSYSWDDFAMDNKTAWTGVRNFQARNNLRAMKKGDRAFYYHSGEEKAVVGLAEVVKEAYPDPTATEGDWVCVDVAALKPLKQSVTLAVIKSEKSLAGMVLLKNSRLSVQPVAAEEFEKIIKMAENKKLA
jgi:predicted RNA-binding protein with PUA-like domain